MSRPTLSDLRESAAAYIEAHGRAVVYGAVGLAIAALILLIGFWPTVLLAAFAAIGFTIGRYRDGDRAVRARIGPIIKRIVS